MDLHSNMEFRQKQFEQATEILKPFTAKRIPLAHWHFVSTIIILWSSLWLSHTFFQTFSWGLFLSIPITTMFMCRSYVIEHDCGHGSFYRTNVANSLAGNLMGFGILIPYSLWKYIHHSHHLKQLQCVRTTSRGLQLVPHCNHSKSTKYYYNKQLCLQQKEVFKKFLCSRCKLYH